MKHLGINKLLLLTLLVSVTALSSCKKVAKEASEKAAKELSEEGTEAAAKKVGKMSLREIGEKAIKNMDFDAFIEYLAKEHPSTHTSLTSLDKDFQRSIFSEMQKHSDFFENVISSRTLLDKYVVFTKDAPKLANNVSMLRYIASNENVMEQMLVKQKGNVVELFQNGGNKLLGKYHDGVLEIVEPFAKDGHTFESSLLRSDMIPNTLYKVKGKMGLNYLIQSDELGRTMTVQARNLNSDDIITNVLRRNQDLNLGNEWLSALKKIKQSSMGDDIDLNVVYKYADNSSAPKSVKITAAVKGKKLVEQSFVNLKKSATKTIVKRTLKGKEALELLYKKHPETKEVIEKLNKDFSWGDNYMIEELSDGSLVVTSLDNSITKMKIKGNVISLEPGSTTKEGAMNQFANVILPNKTYKVGNGCFVYKTDKYGRVVDAYGDRTKALGLPDRGKPYDKVQKEVRADGIKGKDDGGHLFAKEHNGPNEKLNQVPMEGYFNENGAWKELEREETKHIKSGKQVDSRRRLMYKGTSKRPYAIEVWLYVDKKLLPGFPKVLKNPE